MELHVALTTALHTIRHRKPESLVAAETGIRPNQLKKFRAGTHHPDVDDHQALIRCIYEVDPGEATKLANAGLPSELITEHMVSGDPSVLQVEIMEASKAVGHVSETYLTALADGTLDHQELDDIESAYAELARQVSEGLAAVQKARQGKILISHHETRTAAP